MTRTRAEVEATARFTRLAKEMVEAEVAPTLVALTEQAARDERRHVDLCAALAIEFGHRDAAPEALEAATVAPSRLAPDRRRLYEMVAVCCVNETINACLLSQIYQRATWPSIRETARKLLGDEIEHGRLGWAYLAAERGAGRGEWLSGELVPILAEAGIHEILRATDDGDDAEALSAHGEFTYAERVALFEEVAKDVILPGFDAAGLDTAVCRAWLEGLLASTRP